MESLSQISGLDRLLGEVLSAAGTDELQELYLGTYGFVLAKARALVGNEADAKDVAQEVYLRAHASWTKLAAHPTRLGWLLTTTSRVAIDRLRSARVAERGKLELVQDAPASGAGRAEARVLVDALLREESELTQLVVIHMMVDEMTQEETAALLEISRKTVQRHLERFRKRCSDLIPELAEVQE